MSSVQIFPVDPVCGDLIAASMLNDRHRSMLKACIHGFPEDLLHLLRLCGGCNVPVPRNSPEDCVPDTASDDKCLVSMASYIVNDPFRLIGHLNSHRSGFLLIN